MDLSQLVSYYPNLINIGILAALLVVSIVLHTRTSKRGYIFLILAFGAYLLHEILYVSADIMYLGIRLQQLGYSTSEVMLAFVQWDITFSVLWYAFLALLLVAMIQFARN